MVRPIAFGTVTRDALPDQIASRLIALITERQLKAGDRLPPERELAATMGVSRSSLREALRALAMLGVADMRHGDGTYLTNLQPDSLMRSVGLVLAMSDSGLEELFEARKLVEPGLAKLAARADQRRGRRPSCARCAEASATRSTTPRRSCGPTSSCTRRSRRPRPTPCSSGCWSRSRAWASPAAAAPAGWRPVREQSAHDHREIAAAIAAHDAEAAYAAMLRHLENVERAVTG